MTLRLNTIAGFSDLQNSTLTAGKRARAMHVAMIINNAQFGMVRLEFFQDKYIDGNTVILPVSAVDKYNYSRDELTYFWAIKSTQNASTGWLTGPDCLWYLSHRVQQWDPTPGADNTDAGKVFSEEWYRKSSVHNPDGAKSSDGVLLVTTCAQRAMSNLVVQYTPHFQGDLTSLINIDDPWSEDLARRLNVAAKFSVLKNEVIYMGEFKHGDTVPTPISPADGYPYTYAETQFIPSWRWSTQGNLYREPDNYLGQLQRMEMAVAPTTGVVTLRVDYKGDENSQYTTTHGRIAVHALTTRSVAIGPVGP